MAGRLFTIITECLQSSYNINMLGNVSHKFQCSDTVIIESVGLVVGYLCLLLPTDVRYVCISCGLSPTLYSAVERIATLGLASSLPVVKDAVGYTLDQEIATTFSHSELYNLRTSTFENNL